MGNSPPKGPRDARADLEALQARRWASLGRLLGFASGLFNAMVLERVRAKGYENLRPSHTQLLRGMSPQGARITELAERASITKQAMSAIVVDMESLGYVTTNTDPRDGRAKIVSYTDAGISLLRDIVSCASEVESEYNEVLGRQEAARFRESLQTLYEAFTPDSLADARDWKLGD